MEGTVEMPRYGMVIDVAKCTACYSCFIACKDEYWGNEYPPYSAGQPRYGQFWINLVKKERGVYPYIKVAYMPFLCQQCNNPPCLKAAKDGAIYKKRSGIVLIDPQKGVGQKQLLEACPYGVIFWNEEKQLAQKCTFCVHRLEEGKVPRCVQACPSGCIKFGDLNDPESEVAKLAASGKAEVYHPEWNTRPNVYYLNLDRMTMNFISGAVVLGDADECAEGAGITVKKPDGKTVRTRTNAFGNFELEGLMPGNYSVQIDLAGYASRSLAVELKDSEYLGDIVLSRE
jgi:Fe-S-cluster-containing dehydrogenase component